VELHAAAAGGFVPSRLLDIVGAVALSLVVYAIIGRSGL
jgi:hypothetical protein